MQNDISPEEGFIFGMRTVLFIKNLLYKKVRWYWEITFKTCPWGFIIFV